ncbi:metal ABC transporter substrate-binding protein [bacterium]|nr:metal ABC transporter substrate-binding protein [bacterium]
MATSPTNRAVSLRAGFRRLCLWAGAVLCCLWAMGCKAPPKPESPASGEARLVTSFGVVQDWTATLLDDVDQPVVLLDETVTAAQPKLSPVQQDILRRARGLVIADTTLDAFAANQWDEFGGSPETLVRIFEDPKEPEYLWMNPENAGQGIAHLSARLQDLYPKKATRIAKNEERLRAGVKDLDAKLENLLGGLSKRAVLIEDPRVQPFLDRYRFEVEGTLFPSVERALVTPSMDEFRAAAGSSTTRVFIMTSQGRDPLVQALSQELNLQVVAFDPIIEGRTDRGAYLREMQRNAMNLALALSSIPETAE